MEKETKIINALKPLPNVAVAFSGGVDSSCLLCLCVQALGAERVLAVTVTSSMFPQRELEEAKKFAASLGVRHILVPAEEYSIPEFVENGPLRCYYCKKGIFQKIIAAAAELGFSHVLDGSNADDASDYRPGKKALLELGVESPLRGLKKEEIRLICAAHGLAAAKMPSRACLASRIPYGTRITPEALKTIELAEESFIRRGYPDVRVRLYGDLARIELPKDRFIDFLDKSEEVSAELKKLGIRHAALDLDGRVSGSMNAGIDTHQEAEEIQWIKKA